MCTFVAVGRRKYFLLLGDGSAADRYSTVSASRTITCAQAAFACVEVTVIHSIFSSQTDRSA